MRIKLACFALLLAIPFTAVPLAVTPAVAASAVEIDADVNAALKRFFHTVPEGPELYYRAAGVLIFPSVIKAGIGIGGEYGEGALRARGRTIGYYNTVSASIGFQFGAQSRSVIIMFMTDRALREFQRSNGWEAGVDGSVTLIKIGAGGTIDTNNIRDPIIGFVFGAKGLMYNLTLEGSKISRLRK